MNIKSKSIGLDSRVFERFSSGDSNALNKSHNIIKRQISFQSVQGKQFQRDLIMGSLQVEVGDDFNNDNSEKVGNVIKEVDDSSDGDDDDVKEETTSEEDSDASSIDADMQGPDYETEEQLY